MSTGIAGQGDISDTMIEALLVDMGVLEDSVYVLSHPTPVLATIEALVGDSGCVVSADDLKSALLGDKTARLLVLWDTSSETKDLVGWALNQAIPVHDLCAAGIQIERLYYHHNNKEQAVSILHYSRDELFDMEEEDLIAVAEAHGIDHASYPEWEPVVEVILAAQEDAVSEESSEAEAAEEERETPAAPSEGEQPHLYSREELLSLPLDIAKQITAKHGITVEGQRPRLHKYVDAILAFQEEHYGVSEPSDPASSGDEQSIDPQESGDPQQDPPEAEAGDDEIQQLIDIICVHISDEIAGLVSTMVISYERVEKRISEVESMLSEFAIMLSGLYESVTTKAPAPERTHVSPAKAPLGAQKTVRRLVRS